MAKNGFKVLDSDMHVIEPPGLWQRHIEPAYRHRAPKGLTRWPRDLSVEMEGKILSVPQPSPRSKGVSEREAEEQNEKYEDVQARDFDDVSQVWAMDKEGIDVAVLFPSRGLFALAMDGLEPGYAAAISRAYNDWLYEFCQAAPDRMFGAAMLPPHDVEAAVGEARRVAGRGFKAIFMRPNRVNDRNWHDPYYDPLWAECERLGVAVGFHEGGRTLLPQVGNEFDTTMMQHACSHSMGMMLATVSMIGGGVLERFPRLRVAFLEGNCSWVPWLLWRLDEHYEWRGRYEHPELTLMPSEYFKRQCYVSVECDEQPARHMADLGYEDNVVFSTDYPHPDSKYPHAVESFLKLPLSQRTRRKFLWDNCARLYGLS